MVSMPWYLYLALKQLFPTGKGISFFTVMSALGVAIGGLLLVVATSVLGGFGAQYRPMIGDTQGEIQVVSSAVISRPGDVVGQLTKVPGVVAASPFARGNVLIQF